MIIAETIEAIRDAVLLRRRRGHAVAFVPTMGNLHGGHLALIRKAKTCGETVVVSLYVNPLQFGVGEDFSIYPRTVDDDLETLRAEQVDMLFMPGDEVVYPRGLRHQTKVEVPHLGQILEGRTRPEFFRGVTTVVNRLFNIVGADFAVFGKKDYQQLVVIRRMVADLAMPIEIVGVETVREPDGLAMSSRNGYLDNDERAIAPGLYKALQAAGVLLHDGARDYDAIEAAVAGDLDARGIRTDYVSVCRRDLAAAAAHDQALVVLAAGYVGRTRLIDNLEVDLDRGLPGTR